MLYITQVPQGCQASFERYHLLYVSRGYLAILRLFLSVNQRSFLIVFGFRNYNARQSFGNTFSITESIILLCPQLIVPEDSVGR